MLNAREGIHARVTIQSLRGSHRLFPTLHRLDTHFYEAILGFAVGEVLDGCYRFVGVVLRQGSGLFDAVAACY